MNIMNYPKKVGRYVLKAVKYYTDQYNSSTFDEIYSYVLFCNKNYRPITDAKNAVSAALSNLEDTGVLVNDPKYGYKLRDAVNDPTVQNKVKQKMKKTNKKARLRSIGKIKTKIGERRESNQSVNSINSRSEEINSNPADVSRQNSFMEGPSTFSSFKNSQEITNSETPNVDELESLLEINSTINPSDNPEIFYQKQPSDLDQSSSNPVTKTASQTGLESSTNSKTRKILRKLW